MKRSALRIFLLGIAVIAISLLYFFYPASGHSLHPKCIFHVITGLYCPGCGSQRAFSALVRGDIITAANFNVLFVAFIPLIVYSAFAFVWNKFSARKIHQRLFYFPLFAKTVLVTVITFWILRNLPVAPFDWLAP